MKVSKSKLAFITLLIATIIIQGYSIYVYATVVEEARSGAYYCYMVEPLDHEPEKYWTLTEPDPYILEAIEHPGNWTEPFFYEDSTFWFTAEWDDPDVPFVSGESPPPVPFKYNGTYYHYDVAGSAKIIGVTLLDEEPEKYWNLTNPDKYLLEAIENPGKSIAVRCDVPVSDLLKQLPPSPFRYDGKYYTHYVITYLPKYPLPSPFKPEHTAIGLAGVWVVAGAVYILKKRRKS